MHRSAEISDDGRYRYTLRREWPNDLFSEPRILGCMLLNPSTADALEDDQTCRKIEGFARRWGFSGYSIWNPFAFRTSSPAKLLEAARDGVDVVGPENTLERLRKGFADCGMVVCGWGPTGVRVDAQRIADVLSLFEQPLCFRVTQDGHPWHPLYLPYTDAPIPLPLRR